MLVPKMSSDITASQSCVFMLGVYASPRGPLAALFHIIFMLNLRVPPEVELVVGPSVFLNEYSTVKLFLR